LQSVASLSNTYFDSVETVPNTVMALKQAVSQQVIAVSVDAHDWSSYTGVSRLTKRPSSCQVNQIVAYPRVTLRTYTQHIKLLLRKQAVWYSSSKAAARASVNAFIVHIL